MRNIFKIAGVSAVERENLGDFDGIDIEEGDLLDDYPLSVRVQYYKIPSPGIL